ncbi:LysR family transcriptional regulator [Rhizobium sp. 2MFCol3.1]|uniref:LysR family transcriptional regulator n=1 Tax=Rhizobium sp. 2MFCol3.1 TaxID=1246459 RepID=UPI00036C9810|nr:LysR family transcriptional regulator [Rhizobium sp. 2MFCol3.1]
MLRPSINNLDLNLLRVFDAIYHEGNILRAAQRLGMSQPTASHALARLRHALRDDLFVRSATGMMPTAHAERLAEPVRQALTLLEVGLRADTFDAAVSEQTFRVAFDNLCAIAITESLLEEVERVAPHVRLEVWPSGTMDIDRAIDSSEIDLFVGKNAEKRERFASEEIARADFVVVEKAGLDAVETAMSPDEFVARPHLHISSTGDDMAFIDRWLSQQGLSRTVRHSVPLLGCVRLVGRLDALIVLRRPIAEALATIAPLTIRELPFASPMNSICMRWHRRLDAQPAQVWLRGCVRSAFARLRATAGGRDQSGILRS